MSKKILVVDDEPDIHTVIKTILSKKDYDVQTASDGQEALQKLSTEKYDLIILDVLMPNVDGFTVLLRIRESGQTDLPVVMLTAMSSDRDMWKGYEKGATYYLTKPFDNKQMVNIIDYLIGDLPRAERLRLELSL
jgi:two-component system response regulator VicR